MRRDFEMSVCITPVLAGKLIAEAEERGLSLSRYAGLLLTKGAEVHDAARARF